MQQVTEVPKVPGRSADAHKGTFGKVLVAAGSRGMTGAAVLVGKAALHAGSGLVKVATTKSSQPIVACGECCCTTVPLPEDRNGQLSSKAIPQLTALAAEHDITAFGPGCGTGAGVKDCLLKLTQTENIRLVVDADGLNCLAKVRGWQNSLRAQMILTPHPGEMARLWKNLFRSPLPDDRKDQAAAIAAETGTVVVLKGAGTVAAGSNQYYVNRTGNPGMATAGSGDVLTGIITSLWGQGLCAFDAAVAGVYLHGRAGDIAVGKYGQNYITAIEIIECLSEAFEDVT